MGGADTTCRCGCIDPRGASVHAIAAALAVDDLDGAIEAGLLTCAPCPGCGPACTEAVLAARDTRRNALAARERFRAREARLQRRAEEHALRRTSAAAAALARAKAKAAERH